MGKGSFRKSKSLRHTMWVRMEKKYYYTYRISETKVDGYTTTVSYKGEYQYSITVTNTKYRFNSVLPETGGREQQESIR